jgi:DNA gyrase subunit B
LPTRKEFTAAQLKDILESLEKLAKLSEAVRRHGGDFETVPCSAQFQVGQAPQLSGEGARRNEESAHYFHDEKAVRKFHQENLDLNCSTRRSGRSCFPLGEAPARADGTRRRGRLVELHESLRSKKFIAELARKGLKVDHYAASDRPSSS